MSISVAAWNVAGGLGDERLADRYFDDIRALDADVLVIPEAHRVSDEFLLADRVADEGYDFVLVDRDPNDPRKNRFIAMLSRLAFDASLVEIGDRKAVSIYLLEPDITIIGAHLDDRGEEARLKSVDDLLDLCDLDRPNVLAGDLNSAIRGGIAEVLRQPLVSRALINAEQSLTGGDKFSRMSEMVIGKTVARLESAGFIDADPKNRPTFTLRGVPLLQLDHIMANNLVQTSNFKVGKRGASDHRPIKTDINF